MSVFFLLQEADLNHLVEESYLIESQYGHYFDWIIVNDDFQVSTQNRLYLWEHEDNSRIINDFQVSTRNCPETQFHQNVVKLGRANLTNTVFM